jgi:hypothetical protein
MLKWLEKQAVTSKIRNTNRLMYGVLFSVLFLQLFVVVAAPFAAHVGYPLVVAVSSGVATTIYPGPVVIVVAAVARFAIALTTPRRYYGVWELWLSLWSCWLRFLRTWTLVTTVKWHYFDQTYLTPGDNPISMICAQTGMRVIWHQLIYRCRISYGS